MRGQWELCVGGVRLSCALGPRVYYRINCQGQYLMAQEEPETTCIRTSVEDFTVTTKRAKNRPYTAAGVLAMTSIT